MKFDLIKEIVKSNPPFKKRNYTMNDNGESYVPLVAHLHVNTVSIERVGVVLKNLLFCKSLTVGSLFVFLQK